MPDPTFRLEGVVKTRNELEDFEGPLTLILQLLSRNRIEIQDIRISELLDQYLAYLDEMKAMDLEIASEFVAMASHLVYIKARMLLNTGEEPSELEELMQSLETLKNRDIFDSIRQFAPQLQMMYKKGGGLIVKPPEYLEKDKGYPYAHDKDDLLSAMLRVLSRDSAAVPTVIPRIPIPERITYPVSDKTEEILSRLRSFGELRLSVFFAESRSRTELVATFIAMLELCRSGRIAFSGDGEGLTVSGLSVTE